MLSCLKTRTAVACMIAAMLLVAAPARAQANHEQTVKDAFAYVPADAGVVVVVPNLAQLANRVATVNRELGLEQAELEDGLSQLKIAFGAHQGIRDDGTMVIAASRIDKALAGEEPSILVIVPVTDYAEFIRNYDGDAAADVATLAMPNRQTWYARRVDNCAVLGMEQAAIANYAKPNAAANWLRKVGALGRDCLGRSDVAACINVEQLAPVLAPPVGMGMMMGRAQALQGAGDDPLQRELMGFMFDKISAGINVALRDTAVAVVGMDMNENGMGVTYTTQFKPDSTLARMFGNGAEAGPLIRQLPDQPFVQAAAMNFQGQALAEMMDHALEGMPEQMNWLDDAFAALREVVVSTRGVAYTMDVNAQNPEQSSSLVVIDTTNTEQWLAKFRALLDTVNRLKAPDNIAPRGDPLDPEFEPAGGDGLKATYKENSLQLDGVRIDEIHFTETLDGQPIGNEGTAYLAVLDNRIALLIEQDRAQLGAKLEALKEGGLAENAGIQALPATTMLPGASSLGYTDFGKIMAPIFPMMGVEQAAVERMSPLASSGSVRDGGTAGRLYVTMDTAAVFKDAFGGLAPGPGPAPGFGDPFGQPEQGPPPPGRRAPID